MAADVGGLVADIGLNVAGLREDIKASNRELSRGTNRMNRHLGSLRKQVDSVSKGFRGLVGVVGVSLFARHVRETIESADQMLKLTQRIGGTTEAFSELEFVANRSGVAFNTLTMGLQRMVRRVAEAAEGTGEAKNALRELNLDARALRSLSIDEQFEVIAESLFGVKNESDRVRLAMKLFDSEGVALLQTMTNGAEGIRKLRERARDLGVTLSQDMAERAAEANDRLTDLSSAWSSFARNLTLDAEPALTSVLDWLDDFREGIKGTAEVAAGALGFGAQADVIEKRIEQLQKRRESLINSRNVKPSFSGLGVVTPNLAPFEEYQAQLAEIDEQLEALKQKQLDLLTGTSDFDSNSAGDESRSKSLAEQIGPDPDLIAIRDKYAKAFATVEQQVEASLAELSLAEHLFPPEEFERIQTALKAMLTEGIEEVEVKAKKMHTRVRPQINRFGETLAGGLRDEFTNTFLGIESNFSDMLRRMAARYFASSLVRGLGSVFGGGIGASFAALPGFATGGTFQVGGSGGTDSQLVAFRASPDETVTVSRPDQKLRGRDISLNQQIYIDAGVSEETLLATSAEVAKETYNATIAAIRQMRREGDI